MPIELSKDAQKELAAAVKRFLRDELDLDVGDLKAGLVVDFFLGRLAPHVYNQAIADAARFLEEKAADLPGVLHAPEGAASGRHSR